MLNCNWLCLNIFSYTSFQVQTWNFHTLIWPRTSRGQFYDYAESLLCISLVPQPLCTRSCVCDQEGFQRKVKPHFIVQWIPSSFDAKLPVEGSGLEVNPLLTPLPRASSILQRRGDSSTVKIWMQRKTEQGLLLWIEVSPVDIEGMHLNVDSWTELANNCIFQASAIWLLGLHLMLEVDYGLTWMAWLPWNRGTC